MFMKWMIFIASDPQDVISFLSTRLKCIKLLVVQIIIFILSGTLLCKKHYAHINIMMEKKSHFHGTNLLNKRTWCKRIITFLYEPLKSTCYRFVTTDKCELYNWTCTSLFWGPWFFFSFNLGAIWVKDVRCVNNYALGMLA